MANDISSEINYLRGMGIRYERDMIRSLMDRGYSESETFGAVNAAVLKGILRRES